MAPARRTRIIWDSYDERMKRNRPKSGMAPLDGLLALDAVTVVAEQSAQISAAIQAGNAEALSDREFPPIVRVRQQLARARADLRRSVRGLKHQTVSDVAADGG